MEEIAEAEVRSWPVGEPVALRPRMQTITLEVILRLVIGVRDPASLRRLRELLAQLLDQPTTLLFLATAADRDISWFPPWAHFMSIRAEVDELVYREIARRRADASGDDILSLLVQASGDSLSDEELRDELMTLLIAGHETTATALAWAFERLTRHPAALARLREGDPDYLDAVIKETLRVRPVVMEVGRDLTEDTHVGPWELPAGTRVMSSIGLVQKAEEHWPDPRAFRPERFMDGAGPAPYTWIPFGGGPRRCIGASFATTEMAAIIPVVLKHFDLVPDRPDPERSQTRNVTQVPARGARVILTRRPPKLPQQKEAVRASAGP
jgi:cytochrome P450